MLQPNPNEWIELSRARRHELARQRARLAVPARTRFRPLGLRLADGLIELGCRLRAHYGPRPCHSPCPR